MVKLLQRTLLLLMISSTAMAQNFFQDILNKPPGNMNYRYLSAVYVDYDGFDTGLGFAGSFEIEKNIAAQVYYDKPSDGTVFGFDAIAHSPMPNMQSTDLLLGVGFRQVKVSIEEQFTFFGETTTVSASSSESGLVFTAGLRKEMDPDLELNAMAQIETLDGLDIDLEFGGVYEISPILHFQGNYRIAGDEGLDRIGLGVRYYLN